MTPAHREGCVPVLRRARATRTWNRVAVRAGGGAVADDDWRTVAQAATALGVSERRVTVLLANDHLRPARNSAGEVGVQLASIEEERAWRQSASRWARLRRLLRDVLWSL